MLPATDNRAMVCSLPARQTVSSLPNNAFVQPVLLQPLKANCADMFPIAPHRPACPSSAPSCSTSLMCSWARQGCREEASSPSCCCELLHPVRLCTAVWAFMHHPRAAWDFALSALSCTWPEGPDCHIPLVACSSSKLPLGTMKGLGGFLAGILYHRHLQGCM